jgi:antirestriction protein ArdC
MDALRPTIHLTTRAKAMSAEQTNLHNLERLLAGKPLRNTLENERRIAVTVERVGQEFISLRRHDLNKELSRPEVVFHLQGDGARLVFLRDAKGTENASIRGVFGAVPVIPGLQRNFDNLAANLWRQLEQEGYFARADAMGMHEHERLYFGKPGTDPATLVLHETRKREHRFAMAVPPRITPEQAAKQSAKVEAVAGVENSAEPPSSKDVYTRVTEHILKALEKGPGEFKLPWHQVSAEALIPTNVKSHQPYRGVNLLSLWATAQVRGYESGVWATFQQWKEVGATVRKGEKATPCVFWKQLENGQQQKESAEAGQQLEHDGKDAKRFVARAFYVFNADQVDGYKAPEIPRLSEKERIAKAEAFFHGIGADIRHAKGASDACYDPEKDLIQMPAFGVFKSAADYYSTLAHELTHYSGKDGRCGRDLSGRFGSKAYAAEELVAELGAAFSMARQGLSAEPRKNHAAYIANWIELLKEDKRAIFNASSTAQKAVDWMHREYEKRQEIDAAKGNEPRQPPSAAAVEHRWNAADRPPSKEAIEQVEASMAEAGRVFEPAEAVNRKPAETKQQQQGPQDKTKEVAPMAQKAYEQNYNTLMRLMGGTDCTTGYCRVRTEGSAAITVDWIKDDLVSLCHEGHRQGNLSREPEVIFQLKGNQAHPVYYRDDCKDIEIATVPDRFDEAPLLPGKQRGLDSFVERWMDELYEQGVIEKAEKIHAAHATLKAKREAVTTQQSQNEKSEAGQDKPQAEPEKEASSPKDREKQDVTESAEEYRLCRVEHGKAALAHYDGPELNANLTDLLADLQHFSHQHAIDFDHCLTQARNTYKAELTQAKEELAREITTPGPEQEREN